MHGVFLDDDAKKVRHKEKAYTLIYDQKNIMARRRATRTINGLRLLERLHIFSTQTLSMKRRVPKFMKDVSISNEADVLGFGRFAPWAGNKSWVLPFKAKKELFGDEWRVQVGNKTDAEQADELETLDMEAEDSEVWGDVPKETLPGNEQLVVNPGRGSKIQRADTNIEQ